MSYTIDRGIPLSVNMVVTSENYESVYDTGIFIQSLGINSFNASRFIPASASHLNLSARNPWLLSQ